MTTAYIAAPYPLRDEAIALMKQLELQGIEVTSRWLKAPDEMTNEAARNTLADVATADLLIAWHPKGWNERGTGGRHVEFGYAVALHKPILLVGERTNIFDYLDIVTMIDEGDDVASHVKRLKRRFFRAEDVE